MNGFSWYFGLAKQQGNDDNFSVFIWSHPTDVSTVKYAYTQMPGTCNIDLFKNYNFKILRKKLTLNRFAKIMAGFEFHHQSLIKDPCECKVCTVYIHVYCQKYFKTAQNSLCKKVSIAG